MKTIFHIFSYSLLAVLLITAGCSPAKADYDILITGGTVIDGTGSPAIKTDVAINGERIVRIGAIEGKARRVIKADGLYVTPGFIDVHTHCDRGIDDVPTVENYLQQGVTTVIGGNCGGHQFPLSRLFESLEQHGISPNFGTLIGHNTIRRTVMGMKMTPPDEEEMARMKELIAEEMRAGALGFSTGLAYLPGIYADTAEIVELASAVAPYGGLYASHIRNQDFQITESIDEAIKVGEANGIPVLVSHIKLTRDEIWGELERITVPVEAARSKGLRVYVDQYPYTATSSGFTSSFPADVFEGGRETFLERMEDDRIYQRVKDHIIKRRLTSSKGINKLETIFIASCASHPDYEGKNLKEILDESGHASTAENGADLIIAIERGGGAQGVFFQMDEKDVEDLMRLPWLLHASDGGVQVPGEGVPHPRNYGTFPRIIATYVRAKGVLSLEEAVRKMTSLPAQVFGLEERGIISEGKFADITIFDFEEFEDQATFPRPHQYSRGLKAVLVNGTVVVEDNVHLGTKPGRILYGSGKDLSGRSGSDS
jgi:N-acyl-D-amino-acid deacylase